MTNRIVKRLVHARATREGAGVTVHRTIGTPALRSLDPFLMLDHFSSDDPNDYIAGFPDHPHRGFITLTYMLDGHMLHRDSMGNEGDLQAGGAQWMKAASGVIHSEMPQQTAGLMRGFQLWINLPASEKMSAPAYQEFAANEFPVYRGAGMSVTVLSGGYAGLQGPVIDTHTDIQYLDVRLQASHGFSETLNADRAAFFYLFEGEAMLGDQHLPGHTLVIPGDGDELLVTAGETGARFILVSGKPIGEPIEQYGPFVMNTPQEIDQAMADYQAGTLVRQGVSNTA